MMPSGAARSKQSCQSEHAFSASSTWWVWSIKVGVVAKIFARTSRAYIQTTLYKVLATGLNMYMQVTVYAIIVMQANSAGASGDFNTARSQNNISIGCTITGAVSTVVGLGVIIGIIYASAIGNAAASS